VGRAEALPELALAQPPPAAEAVGVVVEDVFCDEFDGCEETGDCEGRGTEAEGDGEARTADQLIYGIN